ncbi:MAG: hypothetical protein JW808_06830 [Victivallales bacterium]|nr:hypothetical protein [Victivallales bacterium]
MELSGKWVMWWCCRRYLVSYGFTLALALVFGVGCDRPKAGQVTTVGSDGKTTAVVETAAAKPPEAPAPVTVFVENGSQHPCRVLIDGADQGNWPPFSHRQVETMSGARVFVFTSEGKQLEQIEAQLPVGITSVVNLLGKTDFCRHEVSYSTVLLTDKPPKDIFFKGQRVFQAIVDYSLDQKLPKNISITISDPSRVVETRRAKLFKLLPDVVPPGLALAVLTNCRNAYDDKALAAAVEALASAPPDEAGAKALLDVLINELKPLSANAFRALEKRGQAAAVADVYPDLSEDLRGMVSFVIENSATRGDRKLNAKTLQLALLAARDPVPEIREKSLIALAACSLDNAEVRREIAKTLDNDPSLGLRARLETRVSNSVSPSVRQLRTSAEITAALSKSWCEPLTRELLKKGAALQRREKGELIESLSMNFPCWPDAKAREWLVREVFVLGKNEEILELCSRAAGDPKANVRAAAISLAHRQRVSVEDLEKRVKSERSPESRALLQRELDEINMPFYVSKLNRNPAERQAAVKALEQLVRQAHPEIGWEALRRLAENQGQPKIDLAPLALALWPRLRDPGHQANVIQWLPETGSSSLAALDQALKSPVGNVRKQAFLRLSELVREGKQPGGNEILRRAADTERDPDTREKMTKALNLIEAVKSQ